nr:chorismate-binding protein [Schaalia georgiae]
MARAGLLDFLPKARGGCAWMGQRRSIVGVGTAWRFAHRGPGAIAGFCEQWAAVAGTPHSPGPRPVAFASFAFSSGVSVAVVPAVAVIDCQGERFVVRAAASDAGTEHAADTAPASGTGAPPAPSAVDPADLPADPLGAAAALLEGRSPVSVARLVGSEQGSMTRGQWRGQVTRMAALLRGGRAQKAVLARDMIARVRDFDERCLLERLSALYPSTWVFGVEGLIGATPEMLASARSGRVFSRVLAGTCAPGEGPALLESDKDLREHALAVESVASALHPLCSDLRVPREPFLLELPNVTHLATDVSGVLDASLLDAVAALHPTAAVCGTPRRDSMELIERYEDTDRGRYAGPVGWIDTAGEGEFALALRCGQIEGAGAGAEEDSRIRLFAGAGIMPDSDPEAELAETEAKMRALLDALGAH